MRIAIDIGHGKNTYPPSKGIGDFAEWDFNNAVGKYAKELAEINGFEVFLTQPLDSNDVSLNTRITNMNAAKVNFGISIHANAAADPKAEGYEFWYWENREQSKKLAAIADANAIALLTTKRRGLKVSSRSPNVNFGILRDAAAPMILCEFGFFTNPAELKLLKSEAFRKTCAKVVVKTACDYAGKTFRNSPEPVISTIPDWKARGLQELAEDGLVTDINNWMNKLDEKASNWLVFTMMNNIYQELKKQKK